jgi:7-cyano-7-deazaguanine reductase
MIKSRKKKPNPPIAGLDRRYDTEPLTSIDTGVLETFPYEYPGEAEVIRIDTNEFTAVCPYSGLPDFGTIRIEYVPGKSIVELRSLKYYLFSYRNVGIYQEHVVNRILRDLVRCCRPAWMRVDVDYNIRGGVHTTVFREWGAKRTQPKRAR